MSVPMTTDPAGPSTPYIAWAKRELGRPIERNLGLSGVARPEATLVDTGPALGAAAQTWREAVGRWLDLDPARVHPALGTSGANHLVYAALAAGGRVAVEAPGYDPLVRLTEVIGASCARFARPLGRRARIDRASLAEAAAGADVIVLTDLHNPGGWRLHPDDRAFALDVAEQENAWLLIDEVYLDFDASERPSAVHASDRIIVTASLTKAHGLGDLRAGWIAGSPAAITRIAAADNLICPGHPAVNLERAAAYLDLARERLRATRARAALRTAQVDAWVEATPGLSWNAPDGGITGIVSLEGAGGDLLCRTLLSEHDLVLVPGRFFGVDDAVRISYDLPEDALAQALEQIAQVWSRLR